MKKLSVIFLALTLIFTSVSVAFAELSSYSKSPTVQDTPEIKDIEITTDDGTEIEIVTNEDGVVQFYTQGGDDQVADDCLVTLKVTPFVEKKTIDDVVCKVTDGTSPTGEVSAEERLDYAKTNPEDGTDGMGANNFKLWRDIIQEASKKNLSGASEANAKIQNKDIAIASIFDVSVWCEKPAQHDLSKHHCVHTIKLTFGDDEMSSLLNNYVALMHFDRAGDWEYIPSKLYEDPVTKEDVVEFQIDCDNLSPFAIAAFSSEAGGGTPVSPQTGNNLPVVYLAAAILCLGLSAFFYIKGKKQ